MCVVSMVGDHYRDLWKDRWPNHTLPNPPYSPPPVNALPPISRVEFDELKRQVDEMVKLLKRAKKYDEDNGEPNCEMEDKVALLKKVAKIVGVDLSEIFGGK